LNSITDAVVERFKDRPHKLKHHLPFRVTKAESTATGAKKTARKVRKDDTEAADNKSKLK